VNVATLRTVPVPVPAGKKLVLVVSAPSSTNEAVPLTLLTRKARLFKRPQPDVISTMSPLEKSWVAVTTASAALEIAVTVLATPKDEAT
jgi:hypothetical protein